MSDTDPEEQKDPLIVCDLKEAVSIDELHTVKAALTGASFILEENLSDGSIAIHRAGPDDPVELPDQYRDHITEDINAEIDEAMASFKKKLNRLAGEGLTEQEQDLIKLARDTDGIPADEAREQLGLTQDTDEEKEDEDRDDADTPQDSEPADSDDNSEPAEEEADDEDEDTSTDNSATTYTCGSCGQEFDAPVKASPKYHDCPGAETDQNEVWTPDTILEAMKDEGWMTTAEIAEGVTGESDSSYAVREKFHKHRNNHPDLDARIESRPDPDDGRRKQYRLKSGEEPADETKEETTEIHPDYVADCEHCDYREEFQDTDEADAALDTHIAEEHSEYAEDDGSEDVEDDPGKNRPGTRQSEAVNPA